MSNMNMSFMQWFFHGSNLMSPYYSPETVPVGHDFGDLAEAPERSAGPS